MGSATITLWGLREFLKWFAQGPSAVKDIFRARLPGKRHRCQVQVRYEPRSSSSQTCRSSQSGAVPPPQGHPEMHRGFFGWLSERSWLLAPRGTGTLTLHFARWSSITKNCPDQRPISASIKKHRLPQGFRATQSRTQCQRLPGEPSDEITVIAVKGWKVQGTWLLLEPPGLPPRVWWELGFTLWHLVLTLTPNNQSLPPNLREPPPPGPRQTLSSAGVL